MKQYKTEDTLLYVNKLSVGYDGKMVLKDISFIEHNITREGYDSTGQSIAIIGRSGRGKSTLFKTLTGLLKPSSGEILITNLNTDDKSDAKQVSEGEIGFVDQKYTLFRHKTVNQICQYALRNNKISKIEKEKLIKETLIEWELFEHINKYPNELSGGQKQRVSIVEQIFTNKHFMILDEPTSGLDVVAIQKVKEVFNKILSSDEYNTIIFSTHNIEFSVEMADSIYILGFPEGETVSTIIKHYDLKAMGLAWSEIGPEHHQLVKEIKELLLKS